MAAKFGNEDCDGLIYVSNFHGGWILTDFNTDFMSVKLFYIGTRYFFPMELYSINMYAVISACNNCFGDSHQKILSLSSQL